MTIDTWLAQATRQLNQAGIGTARLDSLILLEDVTGTDRARLLAEPTTMIRPDKLAKLTKLLKRRASHEPLAYIRGRTEFYGREFVLTPAVLEPRPESETMIALFKALPVFADDQSGSRPAHGQDIKKWRVADIGTGSGALGITAALEVPNTVVELLEIDPEALKIAKINVDKFTLALDAYHSDLLDSAQHAYDILLCNLPYVPDGYQINLAAGHEPPIAIFGGQDGLDLYRRLLGQVAELAKQPLYILSESLPPQHAVLKRLASQIGYKLRSEDDFIQVFERIQKLV